MQIELKQIKRPSGVILYRGKSYLDGSDIVVVATFDSDNSKTGNMIQTWIIRADQHPIEAIKSGGDRAICGNCPHRGNNDGTGRSCYVTVHQAPSQVYNTFVRGGYPVYNPSQHAQYFTGRMMRLGAYGDPVAAPIEAWEQVLPFVKGWTGYTHGWRRTNISRRFNQYLMASCDSVEDRNIAKADGWRTFRVRSAYDAIQSREFICPASDEAGYKKTCEECGACAGLRGGKISSDAGDVTIIVHGNKVREANWGRMKARA